MLARRQENEILFSRITIISLDNLHHLIFPSSSLLPTCTPVKTTIYFKMKSFVALDNLHHFLSLFFATYMHSQL